MNNIKQLKEQYRDKTPGIDLYLDCMTRSLFTGLASFWLGFSGFYFAQKLLEKRLPYPKKFNILVSTLAASGISYKITKDRTAACQAKWMAVSGKYTALQELDDN